MDRSGRSLPDSGIEEYERLLALLDQRRFDEALVRGHVLLEQPTTAPLARAKTHNLLCWILAEGLKRPSPEAVLHGEESVRLAELLKNERLRVQALCNLANAYYQAGDYDGAERSCHAVLSMLKSRPDLLTYGRVLALQGLAQVDLVRGHPREALAKLHQAESLCSDEESRALLGEVHRRKAMVYLCLGEPTLAAEALERVDEPSVTSGPRSLWWRTHLGITRARVQMALGRLTAARSLATNTAALARELLDVPVLAECCCLLAAIEGAEGRVREACRRARAALTYAIQSGRRDVVEDVRWRIQEYLHHEGL